MNNRQFSSHRDKQVIQVVSACKAMTTQQIAILLFPGKAGLRKCQQRLKYLADHKLINFIKRPFFDMPNVYYLKKEPSLSALQHIVAVTWIYVWLSKHYEVEHWETEVDFGILQCDALCKLKEGLWYFIEFDRSISHNGFKKPMQYSELYSKEGMLGSDLLKKLENPSKFPRILIITDSAKRGVKIKNSIKQDNPYGIGYGLEKNEIYLYDEILKEVNV
ncbi:hypothetical protein REC12_11665 [Desulfosporosinus sp. PR]|uniref:hypothetical protein n=1 Tax=Candidatus Desulfosporosinus nitrosoreducens TaxID=3401928 RepID=UPI0027F827F7|nr:hypothetical protein [Desulfosporosinus sp. PR]MDQ7094247.1 hypothetical protein [Desulfosporosinus sp. PR]